MCAPSLVVFACVLVYVLPVVYSHGIMVLPRQRGALPQSRYVPITLDSNAPKDHYPHFPAGRKSDTPGAGKLSQEKAAGSRGWYPYNPYDPNFTFRAGVCGDTVNGEQEHLLGGKFYNNAKIVAQYRQGDTIGIGHSIVSHHNGFIEVHLCDVTKCSGGDISKQCFLSGACVQLYRAPNEACDSGTSMACGPIDRNYPGRWYLPCSNPNSPLGYDAYPPEYATFQLPPDVFCEHCVLQWYWVTANRCNPPGVLDYFDGPDRPDWQQCAGQGGARGGVTRNKKPCGGTQYFAEEYYQCADIQIMPLSGARSDAPLAVSVQDLEPSASPSPSLLQQVDENDDINDARMSQYGDGIFDQLLLWADNNTSRALQHDSVVDVSEYERVGIEATMSAPVDQVEFFVDDELVYTASSAPYFIFRSSDSIPAYWDDIPVNRPLTIATMANGEVAQMTVTFVR
ncbi:unnamed protein product [Agarophyton chilense]